MKKIKLLLLTIIFPFCTFAWHSNGHMTCGAIAYYYVKAHDPVALQKVLATLRLHPWYHYPIWQNKLAGLPAEQQDVVLFMLASTFPDDARDTARYGGPTRALWHYIDYPFVPAGQNVQSAPPASPNAKEKISGFITGLPTEAPSAARAVDLCWLLHCVEDIHQPLHTVSLFDQNHHITLGDKGGNDTYVKVNGGTSQKLHFYWDDLVQGNLSSIPAHAQQLLANPVYKESNLPELAANPSPDDWMLKESFVYAKTVAYQNGAVNGTEAHPSSVDGAYDSAAKKLAEKRVVLAGIRLGRLLSKLFS